MRAVSDAVREQEQDQAYPTDKAATDRSMLVPAAMKAHPMPYD